MAAAVLSSFVSVRFRELHYVRDHDGSTNLDALYDACCAAGLVAVRGGGARERYEAVFDVSLDNALGPFVLDYVEEVCGDRLLTSDDPGLAAILDGEFVASFVAKKMASIEASLVAALKSEAQFGDFVARSLNRDLGKVSLLKSVLEALQRIRGGAHDGGGPAASVRPGVDAELRQAALLQRCFQVLAWCTRAGLHCQPHTGRYSSLPEWMRAVHTRRAGRPAGSTLFLDDMLSSLRIDGAYPFSSLQNMLFMLFLTVREDDDAAWNTKLALLTYYLLDLDYMQPNGALASSLRSTFGAPAPLVACWQCLFLLDCVEQPSTSSTAVITRPSSSIFPTATNAAGSAAAGTPLLQQACALLSQQVQAVAPFKVIQVLVDLGQAGVALTLHRAQSGLRAGLPLTSDHSLSAPDSLSAARTLVGLRLRCGLLTDAFLAMRAHVDGLGGDGGVRAAHTGELVVQIASWVAGEAAASASSSSSAGAAGASSAQLPASPFPLAALVELPWSAEEEDALVGWLAGQLAKGRPAGELLPVYFLGRGRVLESVGAYNRWQLTKQAGGGGGGGGGSDASALCDAMVNAAAALLPMPQRNITIAAPGPGTSSAPWPTRLLAGLTLQTDGQVPMMHAAVSGVRAPPLLSSRVDARAPVAGGAAGDKPQDADMGGEQAGAAPGAFVGSQPGVGGLAAGAPHAAPDADAPLDGADGELHPPPYATFDGDGGSGGGAGLFSLGGGDGAGPSSRPGGTGGGGGEPTGVAATPVRHPKRARTVGGASWLR